MEQFLGQTLVETAMTKLVEAAMTKLAENTDRIANADVQVTELECDLRLLKATLKDNAISSRGKNTSVMREVNRQIRDVVYEIEDAIDNFVSQGRRTIRSAFVPSSQLLDVATQVKTISEKIKRVRDLPQQGWQVEPAEAKQLEQAIKITPRDNMVGFEEELESIIKCLTEEREKLDVISIVGLPGTGKTTLASKILSDPRIKSVIDQPRHIIGVTVSPVYRKKDVLLSILDDLIDVTQDMRFKTANDISELVREHLEKLDRFLIVMDGVYSLEAWTDLEAAFPKTHKASKILITTQLEEVARCANKSRDPLRLRPLTLSESWQLLELEVFRNSTCPRELEPSGRLIAQKCDGHPLLMVMIGKVLMRMCLHGSMLEQRHKWERVAANMCSYLKEEDFHDIKTSFYDKLPSHLGQCFLYMGMFPEEFEIPVGILTRLWMAEGFIVAVQGRLPEDIAHEYLEELINRNLVMVCKRSPDGHMKTCRLHCMLRDFCKKEASSERDNLFQEMKYSNANAFEPPIENLGNCRRLCIESHVNDFFSPLPSCPLVRSFLCFSQEDLQPASISAIPQVLKSLRVLEAKPVTFNMLSNEWGKLALLKYVALSINFKVIPKFISNLQNLQTFVIYTTSPLLKMKANIWKMSRLRHVETNVSTKLPSPKRGEGNQLQTLGMVSNKSCQNNLFDQLCNLRKLGIRGRLSTLVKGSGLNRLQNLEKLKLVEDLSASRLKKLEELILVENLSDRFYGKLQSLPNPLEFPPNLRNLTLYATKLDWSQMSVLGVLSKLEVLKLKDNAFKGDFWVAIPGAFSQLQVLHIKDNDLVVWTACEKCFQKLGCLILRNCRKLEEIPFSLRISLQKLDLKGVKDSVVDSAENIKQAKVDVPFELCIAPEDE